MILTQKQLEIVFSNENLKINAVAGSGKTTTLVEYARERPDKEILYLVFNRELRKNIRKKFTLNTTVHTVNSFIYFNLKDEFKNRKIIEKYNINFFLRHFINKNLELDEKFEVAIKLMNDLDAYVYGNDSNKETIDIFNKIIKDINIELNHDILKKYFLINFDKFKINYDIVLVDEAQDIDVVMYNIISKIKAKKIFVGDKKQSIYGFRKTINIFNESNDLIEKKLDVSFRFDQNLADYINKLTSMAYNENFNIIGAGLNKSVIMGKDEEFNEQYVCISRTNAYILKKAFELIDTNKKISIPFDFEELKSLVYDIYNLKSNNLKQIVNGEIKLIGSYDKLKKLIKSGVNRDLYYIVKIIDEYDIMTLSYMKKLEVGLVGVKYSDIVFMTAHKAKGLEFSNVEIANDFKDYEVTTNIEERNLYYVAITRAKEKIKINKERN